MLQHKSGNIYRKMSKLFNQLIEFSGDDLDKRIEFFRFSYSLNVYLYNINYIQGQVI